MLKWVLGYCLLMAVGLWFGYRSRSVLPSQEHSSIPEDPGVSSPRSPEPRSEPAAPSR
jgi:hypothetical protein